jgi:hypothetical protein
MDQRLQKNRLGGTKVKSKILKVKTIGSVANGNLEPEIANHLPIGVDLDVLEYDSGFAIVKISWSEHPMEETPSPEELSKLENHKSVLSILKSHPRAEGAKNQRFILSSLVEETDAKTLKLRESGLKGSKRKTLDKLLEAAEKKGLGKQGQFIRKEHSVQNQEEIYILDEG